MIRGWSFLTLEGELDTSNDCLRLEKLGVQVALSSNAAGHTVLSAASFDSKYVSPASYGATKSVSWFTWDDGVSRPRKPNGGVSFPDLEDGTCQCGAPRHPDARQAAIPMDATDPSAGDARGIVRKLHVSWGAASADGLQRVLARADEALHLPVAGESTASPLNGKVQVSLLFFG